MTLTAPRLVWLPRLNSRRARRLIIACLATLAISVMLLGAIGFVRWQSVQAVRSDTDAVLTQAAQQLLRALQSRRGTLTMLRDTLEKAPRLSLDEQQALAKSAVAHTRHLLGIGLLQPTQPLTWWVDPPLATAHARADLLQSLIERTRLRNAWRLPSTLTVFVDDGTPLLVMLEPLHAPPTRISALVGVFHLTPMLTDFFELTPQRPYPVELLEHDHALYRSAAWQASTTGRRRAVIERTLKIDGIRWKLHMQPGTTQAARAMSAFHVLLISVSLLAGLAVSGLIWLLVMRTWILQRAVSRRTAALRRTTERLRQLALTDELTGLSNRRFFLERWQWEYDRARRYGRPLVCLMIDVNQFKRINDVLGHPAGDQLLTQVAQELKTNLRQSDILARFGGDEFIIALPETSYAQAAAVAEKLRGLAVHGPWMRDPRIGPVRLSVGLSYVQADDSAQQAIQRADANLYASRKAASSPLTPAEKS